MVYDVFLLAPFPIRARFVRDKKVFKQQTDKIEMEARPCSLQLEVLSKARQDLTTKLELERLHRRDSTP